MSRDEWYFPQFKRNVDAECKRRLYRVGQELTAQIKRNIGTLTSAAGPSRPGGFPHADTLALLKGIHFRVSGDEVIVSSSAPHTIHLEVGTSRMGARPFMRRSMNQISGKINAILFRGG